jgi:hypothetical protein
VEKIRIRTTRLASNQLMSEHAFFEYRAEQRGQGLRALLEHRDRR